jgi:hypothetical protein
MYKSVLLLSLLFLLSTCGNDAPDQGYLTKEDLIKSHFSKFQIEDFEKLMVFFEQQICGTLPATSAEAKECYIAYLKKLSEQTNMGDLDTGISIAEQNTMMTGIRKVSFDALWHKGSASDSLSMNNKFGLKYEGSYHYFLKSFATENEAVQQYVAAFNQSGTITPSMIANVLLNYEAFEIDKQRGRFFMAVHYLTLNKAFAEAGGKLSVD